MTSSSLVLPMSYLASSRCVSGSILFWGRFEIVVAILVMSNRPEKGIDSRWQMLDEPSPTFICDFRVFQMAVVFA